MRFPEEAPFVAIIVGGCILGAVIVISLAMTASELCAHHFISLC